MARVQHAILLSVALGALMPLAGCGGDETYVAGPRYPGGGYYYREDVREDYYQEEVRDDARDVRQNTRDDVRDVRQHRDDVRRDVRQNANDVRRDTRSNYRQGQRNR